MHSTDFEDTIRIAISIGGDSDTIACIAGSIAEPFYGIPADLTEWAISKLDDPLRQTLQQFKESV